MQSAADTIGVRRPTNGAIYLKSSSDAGAADLTFFYGAPGDICFTGDWDGDGIDTVGVYREGGFFLRNSNTGGYAEVALTYGGAGDVPVVGDWDSNGTTTVGVFRNGLFLLRNSNDSGYAEPGVAFSTAGNIPLAGDWDGDGSVTVGVYCPSAGKFYLSNSLSTRAVDAEVQWGGADDLPVVGDWDRNGTTTIGLFTAGTFQLRNANSVGPADMTFNLGGSGDLPLAGRWLLPGSGGSNPPLAEASAGTGLMGEYYNGINFSNLRLTRTDATLNFDWGSGSPAPGMGANTFSVRWTGQVEPRYTQTYTFYTVSDDGIRLWVNNQLLIDNWTDHEVTEDSATIALTGGQKYNLKVEYYENSGQAVARLLWSSASQAKEVVPSTQLYPPSDTTAPVISGISASGITATGATITWATNEASDTQVEYGTTTSYGTSTPLNSALVTSHSASLSGLAASTLYHYRVKSRDAAGNLTTSGDSTFTTAPGAVSGTGIGLRGEYFNGTSFNTLVLTRTDATVNFDWGGGSPGAGLGSDRFSVRWSGQVQPRYSQTYTFYTVSDDGVRLWVDNQLLIDNWTDHPPTEDSATITLTAGQQYDLKMEFYENGGGALGQLFWSSSSQAKEIIPQTQLYPATSTPPPVDTTPPSISNISAAGITTGGATITWTTDEASDTQVEYGTTTSYSNSTPLNSSPVTSHSASLGGLAASTLYHYRVKSRDAASNLAVSGDLTFTTASGPPPTGNLPELPRVFLDTTYVPPTGQTINVPAGGNLQAALNQAQPGDVIALQAGATFTGNFTLPNKSGAGWIVVRSATADANLPPPGTRITPAYAAVMPKLMTPNSTPVLQTAPGAHHFRFIGVEFGIASGVSQLYNLVSFDGNQTSLAQVPYDLIIDRCYLHGNATGNARRGLALNSASTAVIDSYFANFHEVGVDSQAILGWNGPGPFKIVNNYLEGAGENIMFGGGDPSIANLVPSDIEFRRNHCFKPLSWKADDPSYAGTHWSVKNLFELKNARRVLVEGNLFEHNWVDGQIGFAIVLTPRNQDGSAPWSVVEDVAFSNNVVRHTAGAINILGRDDIHPSEQAKRFLIRNNLFDDVGGPQWGVNGRFLQVTGTAGVIVDHNTVFHRGNIVVAYGGPSTGFVFTNNIAPHNEYGVFGDNVGVGLAALERYFPGYVFRRNVLAGGPGSAYPADNFFPASLDQVGFVNRAGGNYRLAATSPYKNAGTDGKDIGCDFDALNAALSAP